MPTLPFPSGRRHDLACLGRLAVDLYAQQFGSRLEDARSFAASLNQPYCGLNAGFEAGKWLEDSAHITSLALIPLHHGGACFGQCQCKLFAQPTGSTCDQGHAARKVQGVTHAISSSNVQKP